MKKAEIIFPYDKWLVDKDKILDIASQHCRFYMYAHHHVYKDISTFEHVHLGMWFHSDNTIQNIAKWFNLPDNSIQKINGQETAYSLYIGLHYNQTDKEPLTAETSEFVHSQGKTLDSFGFRLLQDLSTGWKKLHRNQKNHQRENNHCHGVTRNSTLKQIPTPSRAFSCQSAWRDDHPFRSQ